MARASDPLSTDRGFDPLPFHSHLTTPAKCVCAHVPLSPISIICYRWLCSAARKVTISSAETNNGLIITYTAGFITTPPAC